jgi:hypothetical protein
MPKITVMKTVFWEANGKQMEGKVKQILSDHAIVDAQGSNYVVLKSALSLKPILKVASSYRKIIVA